MKKLLVMLLVAFLMLSTVLIVIPISRCEDEEEDPFTYTYTVVAPPDFAWVGELNPGESTDWVTVIVGVSGPADYPVTQTDGWEGAPSGWIIEADPEPTYTWPSSGSTVTVKIRVTVSLTETVECERTFNVALKPGKDSKKPTPRSIGSGDGIHFKACVKIIPPEEYFTLTVQTDPLGIVEIQGSGSYKKCTYVDLEAPAFVPSEDGEDGMRYRFDFWDVDGTTVPGNPITVHMDADHTATAHYVKQYYLTVQTDPSGLTPAPTPASGWFDECTYVTVTAYAVSGYIFVYWDLDGEDIPGQGILVNPITVHMDAAHTATAHYWLPPEFDTYVTDSNFNTITSFDTVWTPQDKKKTIVKLTATNPGQFMFNIEITNTWPEPIETLTITFDIPGDFGLKGADPIQVWTGPGKTGTRIPATIIGNTLTISGIEPGSTAYITFHLYYIPIGTTGPRSLMEGWKTLHPFYTFSASYTAVWDGLIATGSSSTILYDPTRVLGL